MHGIVAAAVALAVVGSLQVRPAPLAERDGELSAAFAARDHAQARRLVAEALKQPLALPPGHPATDVLGPAAADDLDRWLSLADYDDAAGARVNNLAVALALRGWTRSASAAFGAAVVFSEPFFPREQAWTPVLQGSGGGLLQRDGENRWAAWIAAQQYSGTPNPIVVNIRNLERRTGAPRRPLFERHEFAHGLLYVAQQGRTPSQRLIGLGEILPPIVSRAFGDVLDPSPASRGTRQTIGTVYGFLAQYKGNFIRRLARQRQRRGEDQRDLFGFNPAARLRAGEAFVDVYLVELGERPEDLRREYVAVVSGSSYMNGSAVDPRVVSLGAAKDVDQAIDTWWDGLSGDGERVAPAALQRLAARTWTPLLDVLPPATTRVWVAPDGRLAQVPWQAVAIEATPTAPPSVTIVDAGDTIRQVADESAPSSRTIVLGGNPAYGDSETPFQSLPGTATEIRDIAAIARGHGYAPALLSGADLTKPRLLGMLPASILHIATHGVFHATRLPTTTLAVGPWVVFDPRLRGSDASGLTHGDESAGVVQGVLAMAGANAAGDPFVVESNAFLTDLDLARADLTATDLVVLSACHLGQAEQAAFQSLSSMQTAVVLAGARTLVASLWEVPDTAVLPMMKRFYENLLARGMPRVEALRDAQMAARLDANGRERSPYYWAGWTLFGEAGGLNVQVAPASLPYGYVVDMPGGAAWIVQRAGRKSPLSIGDVLGPGDVVTASGSTADSAPKVTVMRYATGLPVDLLSGQAVPPADPPRQAWWAQLVDAVARRLKNEGVARLSVRSVRLSFDTAFRWPSPGSYSWGDVLDLQNAEPGTYRVRFRRLDAEGQPVGEWLSAPTLTVTREMHLTGGEGLAPGMRPVNRASESPLPSDLQPGLWEVAIRDASNPTVNGESWILLSPDEEAIGHFSELTTALVGVKRDGIDPRGSAASRIRRAALLALMK